MMNALKLLILIDMLIEILIISDSNVNSNIQISAFNCGLILDSRVMFCQLF